MPLAYVSIIANTLPWHAGQLGGAAALWLSGLRRAGAALVLAAGIELFNPIVKVVFNRTRPSYPDPLEIPTDASFPSGHAARVAAAAIVVLLLVVWPHRAWRLPACIAAIVIVLLVALSRVSLGVHWPSDVAGGALSGAVWAGLSIWLSAYLVHRRADLEPPQSG